jgi:hypothetical protein
MNGIVFFSSVFLSSIMNGGTNASWIMPTKYYAFSKFSMFNNVMVKMICDKNRNAISN